MKCTKEGGVCTIREYRQDPVSGAAAIVNGPRGRLRALCPRRFLQEGAIFRWIGEELLNHSNPLVIKEVRFLQKRGVAAVTQAAELEGVGRIDNVLVNPENMSQWCAIETQAVYFSGDNMRKDFVALSGISDLLIRVNLR